MFVLLDPARTAPSGASLRSTRLAVSILVAAIAFLTVELPMWRQRPRSVLAARPVLASVTALAVAAVVGVTTSAVPSADPTTGSPSPSPSAAGPGTVRTASPQAAEPSRAASTSPARRTHTPAPSAVRRAKGPVRVMVVGDSVSKTLAYGIRADAARAGFTVTDEGRNGCGIEAASPYRYFGDTHGPAPGCAGWDSRWASALLKDDPAVTVVLVGRWELMDRYIGGTWTRLGDKAYDARLVGELNHAVSVLTTGGRKVVFATPLYDLRGKRPDGGIWPEDQPWRVNHFIALLHSAAAQHRSNVSVADITSRLFPMGHWERVVNGLTVQSDGVHLTVGGARRTEPVLFPILGRLTGVAPR